MTDPTIDLAADYHVHSAFSGDATSTLSQNIAAASAAGLHTVRLVEHATAETTWIDEFADAASGLAAASGVEVLTGVEVNLLDPGGHLDVPTSALDAVDCLVIADHVFPGRDGPWSVERTRRELRDGLTSQNAVELLVTATAAAMDRTGRAQLAHLFAILPRLDIAEDDVPDELLAHLAATAARTGTLVEVNERWSCPGPRTIAACAGAGATLVAASGAHDAEHVGRFRAVGWLVDNAASSARTGAGTPEGTVGL